MNSNTLLRIFGCFVLSACVCSTHGSNVPVTTGIRGAIKPVVGSSIPEAAGGILHRPGTAPIAVPSVAPGSLPIAEIVSSVGMTVADDPSITTAELAKDAADAQAKHADVQQKIAVAANKVAEEQNLIAEEEMVEIVAVVEKILKASQEAATVETLELATVKAEEAIKERADALEKAKTVINAAKVALEKAAEADAAYKAAKVAASTAEARAQKALKLDLVDKKPTAKIAKERAEAADKAAKATKVAADAATGFASSANSAKLALEASLKNAEQYVKDAQAAIVAKGGEPQEIIPPKENNVVDPPKENNVVDPPMENNEVAPGKSPEASSPGAKDTNNTNKLPDTAEKPKMNYVKNGKYDYQAQLLKEDRCTDKQKKDAGCKNFSNCYLDHSTPVCLCFPGYTSDDATKKACTKVSSPTCKNEANTCHRNANCKENKTLGIGCQCKDTFAGDGLLCSSAFSYFINFFLVLAIVSVQLYM